MPATDALTVLKKVPLFQKLQPGEIREVLAGTRIVQVEAQTEVFPEGAPGDAMYVVIGGAVEIVKNLPGGGLKSLAELGPGAVFGEMSLLTAGARSAGARTKGKSALLKIDRDEFHARLDRGDPAALKMTAHLATVVAGRLRAMDEELAHLVERMQSRSATPAPLYDITEARERVMMQWKIG